MQFFFCCFRFRYLHRFVTKRCKPLKRSALSEFRWNPNWRDPPMGKTPQGLGEEMISGYQTKIQTNTNRGLWHCGIHVSASNFVPVAFCYVSWHFVKRYDKIWTDAIPALYARYKLQLQFLRHQKVFWILHTQDTNWIWVQLATNNSPIW